MSIHYVADASSILPGEFQVFDVEGVSIGVYNIKGEFYAIHNYCPHQRVPLCKGPVCGTTLPSEVNQFIYGKEGEIVRCPLHGWEFDIKTGKSMFSDKVRTRSYPVEIKDGKIGIRLGSDK